MTTVTEAAPGTETMVPVTLIRDAFKLAAGYFCGLSSME
jgi:hypothetical protein